MQIKINDKILSIPPHISTTWDRVSALHMKSNLLAIVLSDGTTITIPSLQPEVIELIFNYHTAHLEKANQNLVTQQILHLKPEQLQELMEPAEPHIRLAFSSLDGLGTAMQHNPAQANAPDIPAEILQKLSAISKILIPEEISFSKAQPSCNCFHCQIARAISPTSAVLEENVSEQDLQFQQWNVTQTGEKLFSVTNRLDEKEKYSVYLGQPLGCTCGKQGCEHIVAVLKS